MSKSKSRHLKAIVKSSGTAVSYHSISKLGEHVGLHIVRTSKSACSIHSVVRVWLIILVL